MKKAICTLCIGEEAELFAPYSHPIMQQYANRIGAEFIVFREKKVNYIACNTINPTKFEKYQLYDVLREYDRAAFLDNDILITPYANNIFRTVSPTKIGGVFEDFGTEMEDRRKIIIDAQKVLGDLGWKSDYMNSGVFVVSKCHQDLFKMIFEYGVYDCKYEQTNTNWYIRKAGFEIKNISYKWNYMRHMWLYYGLDRKQAYFIHYAGTGFLPNISRVEQMKLDFEYFYGK
jgi:lipopolysaccharide biosynthesis glycosyltransferase